MKKLLLISLFVFSFQLLFSQYIPFPEEGSRWSMNADLYSSEPNISPYKGYSHQIEGDTMIDGMNYKKVYFQLRWWNQYETLGPPDYEIIFTSGNYDEAPYLIGAMRQDEAERKVYYIPLDYSYCYDETTLSETNLGEEILLFDFGADVGDTVTTGNVSFTIESIDSVMYNDGIYRKRWNTNGFTNFIEGFGTNDGLFGAVGETASEPIYCHFNCFSINNEYNIGTGIYNCDSVDVITVPVVEIDQSSQLNIYPNPANDVLILELVSTSTTSKDLNFELYNQLGQKVIADRLKSNQKMQVDISGLGAGVYYVSVLDRGNAVRSERIVVGR